MQNRQRHEIVRDILTVCNGGSILTGIMFHTYITHAQATSYLAESIEAGLIEHDRLDRKYRTTAKGIDYLSALESIREMLPLETRKARVLL